MRILRAEVITAVFEKMVAKKPEDRYQSMGDATEALEAVGGSEKPRSGLNPRVALPAAEGGRSSSSRAVAVVREPVKEDVEETGDYEAVHPTTTERNPGESDPGLERIGTRSSTKTLLLVGSLIVVGFLAVVLIVAALRLRP